MSLTVLRCPSCGATVQMPPGKTECFCEYCGNPVRFQRTEVDEKDSEFISTVNAAVVSIRHGDYKTAMDFADKASAIHPGMPAPQIIKSICYMPKDFKKAKPLFDIGKSMWEKNGTIALTDSLYEDILSSFVMNYIEDRDADFKRMIETIRGSGVSDIENVRVFECRRRLDDYYTIPDIKDAFLKISFECMGHMEDDVRFSGQITSENWGQIRRFYKECMYRTVGLVVINPELSSRSYRMVDGFVRNLDLKWGPAFKDGIDGSKDELKIYARYSEPILKWLKSKC